MSYDDSIFLSASLNTTLRQDPSTSLPSQDTVSNPASALGSTTSVGPQQAGLGIGVRPYNLPFTRYEEMESPELGSIRVKLSLRRIATLPPKMNLLKAKVAEVADLKEPVPEKLKKLHVGTLIKEVQAFLKLFDEDYFVFFIPGEVLFKLKGDLERLLKGYGGSKKVRFLHDVQSYLQQEIAAITAAFRHKQEKNIDHWYAYQSVQVLRARETGKGPTEK